MDKLIDIYPEVFAQWHNSNTVSLHDISVASSIKIIWQCTEYKNHIWVAKVSDRTNNNKLSGCPYCSNRKVLSGFNDLATLHPEVLKLWSVKNKINPNEVLSGSHYEAEWVCSSGHEWKSPIYNIAKRNRSCPYCNNNKILVGFNDLNTKRPDLIAEWDFHRNKVLPTEITAGASVKVHWICSQNPNHKWESTVLHRNFHNSGCPRCSNLKEVEFGINDLKSQGGFLSSEFSKDNIDTPENIYVKSTIKYIWVCSTNNNHKWKASPKSRFERNNGCPYCSNKRIIIGENDLATVNPKLASELSDKNNVKAYELTHGSNKKLIWNCINGHEYTSKVNMRSQGRGCPKCMITGFNKGKPAILYILVHYNFGAYKIGITAQDSDRLQRFQKQGWTVVKTFYSSNGEHVYDAEQESLTWVRKDLGLPPFLERTHTGKTRGWTETFESKKVEKSELVSKVESIFKGLCQKRS